MINQADDLQDDPLLHRAPTVEGFKVLDPAVLYARVGRGGMGMVYRGRHFRTHADVAVKVLSSELSQDRQFVLRFEREARLAAQIESKNVVRVEDVRELRGIHYLVMEFVNGETARDRVKRKGPLKEQEALAMMVGAVSGLAAAHCLGIVHRDIKPDNILVSAAGEVKLADLGLAKSGRVGDERSMSMLTSGVMGTPQFMPPEQWMSPDVSPAADVWALGATLYYLLVGKSGIENGELLAVAERIRNEEFPSVANCGRDVSRGVVDLVAKATSRDPEKRYADAAALLDVLSDLSAGGPRSLIDAMAGTSAPVLPTVTPPPRDALHKIRDKVQTKFDIEIAEQAKTVPTVASQAEQVLPTSEPTERDAPEIATALAALRRDDGLDEGITLLRSAHESGIEAARTPLIRALCKKSQLLAEHDLDAAFEVSQESLGLDSSDTLSRGQFESVRDALRDRLIAGLTVEPVALTQVDGDPAVEVRGTAVSPRLRTLRLGLCRQSDGDSEGDVRHAVIIVGEFREVFPLHGYGLRVVRITAEDENGVEVVLPGLHVPGRHKVGKRNRGESTQPGSSSEEKRGEGARGRRKAKSTSKKPARKPGKVVWLLTLSLAATTVAAYWALTALGEGAFWND